MICKHWRVCENAKKAKLSETYEPTNTQTSQKKSERGLACPEAITVKQKKSAPIENETYRDFSYSEKILEKRHTIISQSIDEQENTKDKLRRRSQGLCQHCGNPFKKKYLFFGDSLCVKCGKKKDY
jgi:hypothetical protein